MDIQWGAFIRRSTICENVPELPNTGNTDWSMRAYSCVHEGFKCFHLTVFLWKDLGQYHELFVTLEFGKKTGF